MTHEQFARSLYEDGVAVDDIAVLMGAARERVVAVVEGLTQGAARGPTMREIGDAADLGSWRVRRAKPAPVVPQPQPEPVAEEVAVEPQPVAEEVAVVEDERLCWCGCGEPAPKRWNYRRGHKTMSEKVAVVVNPSPSERKIMAALGRIADVGIEGRERDMPWMPYCPTRVPHRRRKGTSGGGGKFAVEVRRELEAAGLVPGRRRGRDSYWH